MLKSLELSGFKSFAKKSELVFTSSISAIVGPNGSGKSNIAEAFRFVLGEQSLKSMRGRKGEDLVFGGTDRMPRAGRAAVKVMFDNGKRLFDIDFEEVVIERVVHRDGVNEYHLNGSQVRLRDVVELLAKANIGASGHHIISQGEADRILSTHPRERKEMVEDALGLRIYHYKLAESGRKLKRTRENIEQVSALRREIAPHLKFLKRQVEKVEKTRSLRDELKELYREYLKREELYLAHTEKKLQEDRRVPEERLEALEKELKEAKEALAAHDKTSKKKSEVLSLESDLRAVREKKDGLVRELGRIEGELSAYDRRQDAASDGDTVSVRRSEFDVLRREVEAEVSKGERALSTEAVTESLRAVATLVSSFVERLMQSATHAHSPAARKDIESLRSKKNEIEQEHSALVNEESELVKRCDELQKEVNVAQDAGRDAERQVFAIMSEQQKLRMEIERLKGLEQKLRHARSSFETELKEGSVLVGSDILSYKRHSPVDESGRGVSEEHVVEEERSAQEKRRRAIERIKIRLEEAGSGSGEEIVKEYTEVEERDSFLEKETADLERAEASLRIVIDDLENTLGTRFQKGIASINEEFTNFFALMFGGGNASLSVIKEPKRRRMAAGEVELGEGGEGEDETAPEFEEGIDIKVNFPRKRIKGLEMLSGGERALTSIALLFAMSQVNPPPFLILDETDAALDEANSRRYGDMIENLAERSQLILITHNRETMRRAGVLYGVTMGGDGVSKLLSVQFGEALAAAQ